MVVEPSRARQIISRYMAESRLASLEASETKMEKSRPEFEFEFESVGRTVMLGCGACLPVNIPGTGDLVTVEPPALTTGDGLLGVDPLGLWNPLVKLLMALRASPPPGT